jgi:hypothetical protein
VRSYQVTRWNGEQAKSVSRTNAINLDAARSSSLAEAETEIDVTTFIQWVDAHAQADSGLADFYVERFREEFRSAFDAWIAAEPLAGPGGTALPVRDAGIPGGCPGHTGPAGPGRRTVEGHGPA